MTNAIHADEKQSREGLLFGLDRGRAACPLDCLRKRGSGFYRFRGFSGGGAAHKNIEAPRRFETGGFLVSQTQSLATHLCLPCEPLTFISQNSYIMYLPIQK